MRVRFVLVVDSRFVAPYCCDAGSARDGGQMVNGRGRYRESERPERPPGVTSGVNEGRRCISVIGIDEYRRWDALSNAVGDARGVLAAFEELGFVPIAPPLLDGAATCDAIRRLPDRKSTRLNSSHVSES